MVFQKCDLSEDKSVRVGRGKRKLSESEPEDKVCSLFFFVCGKFVCLGHSKADFHLFADSA